MKRVQREGDALIGLTRLVTKKWANVRKAEERDQSRMHRRSYYMTRPPRETIKDVAADVMAAAYLKASANGTLPAHARQIMYAARGPILERTERDHLDADYFTQTLLPDYIRDHPEAGAWDVVFDARGHFAEPHTEKTVPLGTLDVRGYLHATKSHAIYDPVLTVPEKTDYPTSGPEHRFGAILFIEKEGFLPLFKRVQLAERYDLAIMSTKGMTVTAARQLVDDLCADHEIPLLVLHDFDKAGFSILGTLQRDTRRYEFANAIQVIDFGLRLADVQAHNLAAETVGYGKSDPTSNLQENGATAEEVAFLCSAGDWRSGWSGRRVELNAFPSDRLVAWIESKLAEHGIEKMIPDAKTLEKAYRRAIYVSMLLAKAEAITEKAEKKAKKVPTPKGGLTSAVRKHLEADRRIPWDRAVARLALMAVPDAPDPDEDEEDEDEEVEDEEVEDEEGPAPGGKGPPAPAGPSSAAAPGGRSRLKKRAKPG